MIGYDLVRILIFRDKDAGLEKNSCYVFLKLLSILWSLSQEHRDYGTCQKQNNGVNWTKLSYLAPKMNKTCIHVCKMSEIQKIKRRLISFDNAVSFLSTANRPYGAFTITCSDMDLSAIAIWCIKLFWTPGLPDGVHSNSPP